MKSDQTEIIYLGLGSNLGNREANLEEVFQELPPEVIVFLQSALYETKPWGYLEQPDFLNLVVQAKTELSPRDLLVYLKNIEKKIGRKPSLIYGPRLVDIDILLYGNQIINEKNLTIPHKKITERAFVLVPLVEIAPDLSIPDSNKMISKLLESIDSSGVSLYEGPQE
ncbi:MAG: 2-amino-4-hydroxy-6-hydroxymethyldihydropteridine diphosphokinase [Anaerolineales bacterium]|nr:2-amino-4-hydroxy-6-hydroxymethyldihydropteridine diphosphokinase [Anaerolineales bacterium]